ncbi:MAG: glycoside hydrolase family 73 protein [Myxococcota bacterium]
MLACLRHALGLALAIAAFVAAMPAASPRTDAIAGIAQRGPAARLRARLDRATAHVAEGRTADALDATSALLADLEARRGSPEELLADDVILGAAREAAGLRAEALLAADPPRAGFRADFLRAHAAGATFADWALGVPASVTLAQAVLESDWGRSAPGNNLFGLKGEGPAGSTVRRVVEYRGGKRRTKMAPFRAYPTVDGSMVDHGEILARSRRYARARAVAEDADAYARALQGVYATDPRYARKLSRLMDDLGLRRFDWFAHAEPRAGEGAAR